MPDPNRASEIGGALIDPKINTNNGGKRGELAQ